MDGQISLTMNNQRNQTIDSKFFKALEKYIAHKLNTFPVKENIIKGNQPQDNTINQSFPLLLSFALSNSINEK